MNQKERVLVLYATWHGQTERIAERIAKIARDRGYDASVMPVGDARRTAVVNQYDRFILCSGVHVRRHHRDAEAFARRFRDILEQRKGAFVSVSLAATAPKGSANRKGIEDAVTSFSQRTGWWPAHTIYAGGCLAYTKYNPLVRWVMKRIARANGGPTDTSRDYETTDWTKLAEDVSAVLPPLPQNLHPVPSDARQLRADIEEGREEARPQ